MKDIFVSCINNQCHAEVTFNSKEKGLIVRNCIPFDYGPSRKYRDGLDRFHFYDLDSPDGKHNLSILPEQLVNIRTLEQIFNPGDYVTWKPSWFVKRDWGIYS
ncbi:hypothetical protein [Anaerospora sp.]|uniref:hypothetical protein n=1 Tax=Anaerospora sp. TaxID=1960278 RepID=UPI0028A15F10|nr:hypothetical protein [Anaerospora sp.]